MLALALLRQALRREREGEGKKKSNFPLFEGIVQQVEMLGDIFLKASVNEDIFFAGDSLILLGIDKSFILGYRNFRFPLHFFFFRGWIFFFK